MDYNLNTGRQRTLEPFFRCVPCPTDDLCYPVLTCHSWPINQAPHPQTLAVTPPSWSYTPSGGIPLLSRALWILRESPCSPKALVLRAGICSKYNPQCTQKNTFLALHICAPYSVLTNVSSRKTVSAVYLLSVW